MRAIQKFDLGVQALLILSIVLSVVYGAFERDGLFVSIFVLFILGVWQLISALLYTLSANRIHAIYFAAALTYCVLLYFGVILSDQIPNAPRWLWKVGTIPMFVLPFFASIYYFFMCERAINNE